MAQFTIDATGKKLGRVATEAAVLLMGKDTPAYERNAIVNNNVVQVINVSKALISDKKKEEKFYKNFSGFADGLRELSMKRTIEKQGTKEVFRKAIYGMLPRNKLRSRMMVNLKISE